MAAKLSVNQLQKRYGDYQAVRGVSFENGQKLAAFYLDGFSREGKE